MRRVDAARRTPLDKWTRVTEGKITQIIYRFMSSDNGMLLMRDARLFNNCWRPNYCDIDEFGLFPEFGNTFRTLRFT